MTERLGHKQTAAMFTLMVLAREVSNPELKTVVGFPLDGKYRVELNKRGLVASSKQGRAYVHELTDQGWAWCAEEMQETKPPEPSPRSSLAPAAPAAPASATETGAPGNGLTAASSARVAIW